MPLTSILRSFCWKPLTLPNFLELGYLGCLPLIWMTDTLTILDGEITCKSGPIRYFGESRGAHMGGVCQDFLSQYNFRWYFYLVQWWIEHSCQRLVYRRIISVIPGQSPIKNIFVDSVFVCKFGRITCVRRIFSLFIFCLFLLCVLFLLTHFSYIIPDISLLFTIRLAFFPKKQQSIRSIPNLLSYQNLPALFLIYHYYVTLSHITLSAIR